MTKTEWSFGGRDAADEVFCGPISPRRPFPPLNWRWLYAGSLARSGRHPGPADDQWVAKAFDLRRCCGGEAGVASAPAARAAHNLYCSAEPFGRWVFEARLLAGQSPIEAGRAQGLKRGVARAYQKIFFDATVLTRTALFHSAVSPLAGRQGPGGAERALKLFAFRYGVPMLERVVEHYTTEPPAIDLEADSLTPEVLLMLADRLEVRLAIEADALPPCETHKILPLMSLVDRLRLRAAGAAARSGAAAGA